MKANEILLLSDLDGTLLNSRQQVTAENNRALAEFTAKGGLFSVATGRKPDDVMQFFRDAKPNAPLCCQNGAQIFNWETQKDERRLYVTEEVLPILDALTAQDAALNVEIIKDEDTFVFHPGKGTEKKKSVVQYSPITVNDYREVPFPWTKIAFWLEPEQIPSLRARVEALDAAGKWHFMRVHEWSCELLHPQADKGYTVEWFRKRYPERKIVAVGDNENDVILLKNADIGFAPSNAFPVAKAAADTVLAASCDEDAIAALLKSLLTGETHE